MSTVSKQLSKSDYILYLKHPAWLWLKKNDKAKLPQPDAALQALFDEGNLFESIVEEQFIGITRLGFESYQQYLELPAQTKKLIESGERLISQGRFEHDRLTCICDVVEQVGQRELEVWEIKASTGVKPEHIEDLAFQAVVLERAGYKIKKVGVIHCNNRYIRQGQIDPSKLSTAVDVSDKVFAKLSTAKTNIEKALKIMDLPTMPDPSPARARMGGFKQWLEIYQGLHPNPEPYHVHTICRGDAQLFGELENRGITNLVDIPPEIKLKPAQARQVEATRAGRSIIDEKRIAWFLKTFEFPLSFLDYETLGSVIPPFDGLRPYEQLPFQYSLHILDRPGVAPKHHSFLHKTSDNPALPLLETLQEDLPSTGTILVWNEGFEKKCNQLMSKLQPEFGEFLANVNSRIKDLMSPFWNGWYLHADFCGSASIKKVLPVLVPELSYKDLEISEGTSAQRLWMQTVLGGVTGGRDRLMSELEKYCKLDTLAMLKIYEILLDLKPLQSQTEQLSLL